MNTINQTRIFVDWLWKITKARSLTKTIGRGEANTEKIYQEGNIV